MATRIVTLQGIGDFGFGDRDWVRFAMASRRVDNSEDAAFVETVMGSQQISPVIDSSDSSASIMPSAGNKPRSDSSRKRGLSESNDVAHDATDTPKKQCVRDVTGDTEIIRQMRLMTDEMKDTFESRFDKLEDRLRNEFMTLVRSEIKAVKVEFNNRVENLSKKLEEKLTTRTHALVEAQMTEVRGEVQSNMLHVNTTVDNMKKTYADATANVAHGPTENLSFVIRNLDVDQREEHDQTITMNKVKALIKDGLKLSDITIKSVCRKKNLSNNRPGVIIASVDNGAQKTKLMKCKSSLKQSRNFHKVYIEDDRPQEIRTSEANMRTVLHELGKSDKYVNINGRFVRKRDNTANGTNVNTRTNDNNANNRPTRDNGATRNGNGHNNRYIPHNNNNNTRR